MANKKRLWLIKSIRRYLIPAFEARGFQVVPWEGEEARCREIQVSFPFGRLRRYGPKGLEAVEVQLDGHGTAAFRINAGVVPLEKIKTLQGKIIAPEDMYVAGLPKFFMMYRCVFLSSWLSFSWFAVRRWSWQPEATEADYDQLAKSVADLIPEIEDALREVHIGRHIRVVQ